MNNTDQSVLGPPPPSISATTPTERRRAVASSFLGTTVEYYDFLLYGAAAGLVFPKLFFVGLEPGLALLLSYLTLFMGYISRPIGGLLFGHFGDKFGRKNMLVITLMIMGFVSIAVGLMPTAETIGIAAPIALTALRIIQGFAVGGEWAGAMLMSMEHSTTGKKGLGASLSMAGAPTGAVLATLVLALFANLPDETFMSWGWRVPFLLSAVVVVIGLFLRTRVSESPEFQEARRRGEVHTGLPLAVLFSNYKRELLLGSLAAAAPLFLQGLLAVHMVPFVVATGAMPQSTALLWLTASNALHVFTIPFFAWLSDRLGRKPVMAGGAVFSIIALWPMFMLFNTGDPLLAGLAFLVGNPLIQASMFGPVGAYLSELFDTGSRYSGVSGTYQMASVLGSGLAPIIGTALSHPATGTNNLYLFMAALYLVSGVAVLLSKSHAARQMSHEERFVETQRFQG